MPALQVLGVSKRFGRTTQALDDVALSLDPGDRLALIGPSGSGKSTLLRAICGLEIPDNGEIFINGRSMSGVPPWKRNLALVAQTPVLLPHRNVTANLTFGMRARGLPRAQIAERVAHVAHRLHIKNLFDRSPRALSGGERQRVALARAILGNPDLLLLDEPLAALDPALRIALRTEIHQAVVERNLTAIWVTHDITDALTFASKLAVLSDGRLADFGTTEAVYLQPGTLAAARCLGDPPMNLLPCRVVPMGGSWSITVGPAPDAVVFPHYMTPIATMPVPKQTNAWLGLRPEHARVRSPHAHPDNANAVLSAQATLEHIDNRGAIQFGVLRVGTLQLVATIANQLTTGSMCLVDFDLSRCIVYDGTSGSRLAVGLMVSTSAPL